MITIRLSRPDDRPRMFTIWLEAVRATHGFLTENDIAFYAEQVRDHYLPSQPFWIAAAEDDAAVGFMGMTHGKIDALFVHPVQHGNGVGTALITHAASLNDVLTVDVNERNPGACAFYRKLGFRRIGRSDLDASGNPFPILHLARGQASG